MIQEVYTQTRVRTSVTLDPRVDGYAQDGRDLQTNANFIRSACRGVAKP